MNSKKTDMAAHLTNWAYEINTHDRESENKTLAKAKAKERELIEKGYRWYEITPTYRVLIPCNDKGYPTAEGQKKLMRHKELLGI